MQHRDCGCGLVKGYSTFLVKLRRREDCDQEDEDSGGGGEAG